MSFKCCIDGIDNHIYSNIYDMPSGSIGITKDNLIYLRTAYCAICLSRVGASYSSITYATKDEAHLKEIAIRLLPKGTKIILEVE